MKCKECCRIIEDDSLFCRFCGAKIVKERRRQKKKEVTVPEPKQLPSGNWHINLRKEGISITEDSYDKCKAKAIAARSGYIKIEKRPKKKTLDAATTDYIESREGIVSPSTIQTYIKKQRLYFTALKECDVHEITEDMIQKEIQKMIRTGGEKGKLSAKTIKDAKGFLQSVLMSQNIQLDWGKIKTPTVQASPYSVLNREEQIKLIEGVQGNPCELEILLALMLGLRRSEIMAIEKSDFDFEHNTLKIDKAVVRDKDGNYVQKGTKTAKSARLIKCPTYLMDVAKDAPEGKIYAYDANYILKCLHKVCDEQGIPQIRLHDLRHVNASACLDAGIRDKYVMERLGWANKDQMVYRYEHTSSEEKVKADDTINAYFDELCNFTHENANENKIPHDTAV